MDGCCHEQVRSINDTPEAAVAAEMECVHAQ